MHPGRPVLKKTIHANRPVHNTTPKRKIIQSRESRGSLKTQLGEKESETRITSGAHDWKRKRNKNNAKSQ